MKWIHHLSLSEHWNQLSISRDSIYDCNSTFCHFRCSIYVILFYPYWRCMYTYYLHYFRWIPSYFFQVLFLAMFCDMKTRILICYCHRLQCFSSFHIDLFHTSSVFQVDDDNKITNFSFFISNIWCSLGYFHFHEYYFIRICKISQIKI